VGRQVDVDVGDILLLFARLDDDGCEKGIARLVGLEALAKRVISMLLPNRGGLDKEGRNAGSLGEDWR
jgi:hypothetical protein